MGAAQVIVAGLLFTFALGVAGMMGQAEVRARSEIAAATRAHIERGTVVMGGEISVESRDWNSGGGVGKVEITLKNTGGYSFDADRVDPIVDGTYMGNNVVKRTVNDKATRVWAPGEELYLRIQPVSSSPTRVYVVTETGAAAVG